MRKTLEYYERIPCKERYVSIWFCGKLMLWMERGAAPMARTVPNNRLQRRMLENGGCRERSRSMKTPPAQKCDTIKGIVGRTFRLLVWDWPSLLLFELIYKFILLLLVPYAEDLLRLALQRAGTPYLTNGNLLQLLQSPLSLFLLLLLLLLLAFSVYLELTAVVLYCESGRERRKIGPFSLLWLSLKKAVLVWRPKRTAMLALVLLFLPLSGFVLTSGSLVTLRTPEFILDFLRQKTVLYILYLLAVTAFQLLLLQWIFGVPEMVLHNTGFREACKSSRALLKGRWIKTLLCIFAWTVFMALIGWLLYCCGIAAMLGFVRLTEGSAGAAPVFWSQLPMLQAVAGMLAAILSAAGNMGLLVVLYHRFRRDPEPEPGQAGKKRGWRRTAILLPLSLILLVFYIETTSHIGFYLQDAGQVQIVAHRAGALDAPENTLAALRQAEKNGAEYAEIDVQQTRDGALIVMHDTNFKRTAGVDRYVWDVTLEEAQRYNADHSFPSDEFSGEKIPTLAQMIEQAKGKIGLMIELKSNGHEQGLEEAVIEAVRRGRFEGQCIVASMDYQILKRVRELAPDLQTAYIVSFAYGDFGALTAADAVSVEASFATSTLKAGLNALGKPLYVWTVNQEEAMRRVFALQPKGLITDDVRLAQSVRQSYRHGELLSGLVEAVLGS